MIRSIPTPARLATLRRRVATARLARIECKDNSQRSKADRRYQAALKALARAEETALNPFSRLASLV